MNESKEFYSVDEIEGDDNHLKLNFRKKQAKISESNQDKLLELNEQIGS